jgi:hypothetical protein
VNQHPRRDEQCINRQENHDYGININAESQLFLHYLPLRLCPNRLKDSLWAGLCQSNPADSKPELRQQKQTFIAE